MAYENYETPLIMSFEKDVREGIILPENIDLQSAKARNKFNKYINDIQAVKAYDFKISDFNRVGLKSVSELSLIILIRIFGDKIIDDVIEFFRHLHPSKTTNPLDGISLTIKDTRDNSITNLIEVPDIERSSSVVCIVHEFIHYYFKKLNVDFHKKRYYEEIFSIYGEKVACHILEQENIEHNFTQKIEEVRLEGITWHYKVQAPTVEDVISLCKSIEKNPRPSLGEKINYDKLSRELPIVKTAEGLSILRKYYETLADSYGIGYLYAENLFQKYLEDEQRIFSQIREIQSSELTVQNLLNYYGINAKNYETYNAVNKRLEQVKRGKH